MVAPQGRSNLVFVRDAVIFPGIFVELHFSNSICINAVNQTGENNDIIVVTQKDKEVPATNPEQLYKIGVIGTIKEIIYEDEKQKVLFESKERVRIIDYLRQKELFEVAYEVLPESKSLSSRTIALKNNLINSLKKLINSGQILPFEAVLHLLSTSDPNKLINGLIPLLENHIEAKQEILELTEIENRLEKVNILLGKYLKISELEQEVAEKTQAEISKAQKEVFLREELKAIQKELGETELNEYDNLRNKINAAGMPEPVKVIALRELSHLEKTPSFSPEISYIKNYLDWLIEMPWSRSSRTRLDIREAREILDRDHYGLDKIKERVLEYLAVHKLVGKIKGPILCFVGPPGTGKTSIGQSIARAMGRKFVRVSLGGIRDEAEIRGHRRTYVGAMPGRIIQVIHQIGENNPVFMLDELDKMGVDFRGDPSSALLEALDPVENNNFSDHYLEAPFDLSKVMFITTANLLENIPAPLRDRMEIIEFPGYTSEEKFNIAKQYIWPKILESHGLSSKNLVLEDAVFRNIINNYTLEAGVRNLERELSKIARKLAFLIASNENYSQTVTANNLVKLIGPPKIEKWSREVENQIGLVAALAVTEGGGEILSIESSIISEGKGHLILTGNLGEVMKESAQAALTYVRNVFSRFNIDPREFYKNDIHVHVPSGAISKDGPSAGVAIASAILSSFAKRPVDAEVGMTGEITLRGRILKIGGLKEKILAAKRAGLKKIIFPFSNKNDLSDIPAEYQVGMNLYAAKNMDEVLNIILK